MASRLKEDEKNERSIRNLLKLPENRRCINCNSLGPQYVCTNFSTFVCTPCSGIHREFTHRVKSVSMAKFTPQEVSALQGGGNASAREIYLKEWDSQRNSLPDGSNIDRLRDFIKHVYVDRRYTGERSVEKPPRAKGETEDFTGNSRRDTYQGGSRSPPYDDTFERRYGDRPSSGGRSPSYDQGNRQSSDYKKSPAREVINDWRREDRFGNDRRSEERSSHGSSNLEIRSPDHRKDSDISSPPLVRPVRDILGDNVSPLRVIEPPPKSIGATSTDGRAPPAQRTASSSSLASSDVNPSDIKVEASFIDFDAIPEPPTSTVQQAQVAGYASSVPPTTSSSNDWANFDSLPEMKTAIPASNSMESILSGLSVPASSSGSSVPRGTLSSFQFAGVQGSSLGSSSGSTSAPSAIPSGVAPVSSFGSVPTNATTGGQWPTMNPQQQSLFPGGIEQPVSGGSSSYKSWNPHIPNTHGPPGAYFAQVGQAGAASGSTVESTRGRKALPEDLFAMNYSYSPSPVSGWYAGASYVARVPMHYNMPKAVANFQAIPTSNNPFDVNEPSPVQASAFPSMASLQGALPRTATPPGVLHNQNYGASPYAPPVLAKTPPYAATISSSSFMGQGIAGGSMAPSARPQGLPIFSPEESGFAYLYPNPQAGGLHPAAQPASSNLSFTNGNPFG